jgi:hypothetical protein
MKIKVDDFSVETSPYTHAGLMITPVISGLDYDVHVYVLDGLLCIKVYDGPEMHPTLDVSFPTQDDATSISLLDEIKQTGEEWKQAKQVMNTYIFNPKTNNNKPFLSPRSLAKKAKAKKPKRKKGVQLDLFTNR